MPLKLCVQLTHTIRAVTYVAGYVRPVGIRKAELGAIKASNLLIGHNCDMVSLCHIMETVHNEDCGHIHATPSIARSWADGSKPRIKCNSAAAGPFISLTPRPKILPSKSPVGEPIEQR